MFYKLSFDDKTIKILLLSRSSSRQSNFIARSLPLPHSRLWTLNYPKSDELSSLHPPIASASARKS